MTIRAKMAFMTCYFLNIGSPQGGRTRIIVRSREIGTENVKGQRARSVTVLEDRANVLGLRSDLLACDAMTEGRQPKQLNKTGGEAELVQREAGLQHQLSAAQVAMIALGSTIGTGLFLTSAIS